MNTKRKIPTLTIGTASEMTEDELLKLTGEWNAENILPDDLTVGEYDRKLKGPDDEAFLPVIWKNGEYVRISRPLMLFLLP
jgi:hypothetical protein